MLYIHTEKEIPISNKGKQKQAKIEKHPLQNSGQIWIKVIDLII